MKETKAIVISDRRAPGVPYYLAEDLRREIVELREMVRELLREADEFSWSVADVMNRLYVLDWLAEKAEFTDMGIPGEPEQAGDDSPVR